MKLFNSIILLTILLLPLSANQDYEQIIITKTSSKSSLGSIKQKLNALNIKMFVQKSDNYYKVYSQKFSDKKSANQALNKLRDSFPYARLLLHDNVEKKNDINDFFIGFALGFHKLTTNNSSSSSGLSYALEAGYNYTRHINSTLAYLNTSTSDVDINNIYTSLNYNFDVSEDFDIYMGGLVGYSTLKLKNFTSSSASSAILLGIQTGVMYNFSDSIGFYTAYQGLSLGHKVDVTAGATTSSVDVSFLHNIQIGVQYRF